MSHKRHEQDQHSSFDVHFPQLKPQLKHVVLFSFFLKLLLFPASYSTDLNVHRHWKHLTTTQSLSSWYTDTSASCCPLDYPPLFAFFEYILAKLIQLLPSSTTTTFLISYSASRSDVFLLRATVLLADLILVLSVYHLTTSLHAPNSQNAIITTTLILLSPALTLVDILHFQYNNLPLAFLFLSISSLIRHNSVLGAFFFSLALNAKHTFLPLTPPVALCLLQIMPSPFRMPFAFFKSFFPTVLATITPFICFWTPFYLKGGFSLILSILKRLFPFSRGLLHANWASNFWAIYAAVDTILSVVTSRPTLTTRGHISIQNPFVNLPNPTPITCIVFIIVTGIPALLMQIQARNSAAALVTALSIFATAAFIFGWHVHEKAILQALLPLLVAATIDNDLFIPALWMSIGAQFALFELVRGPKEALFAITHFTAFHIFLFALGNEKKLWKSRFINCKRTLLMYALGCIPIECYAGLGKGHWILFGDRLPFLPLLIVSLYSAIGVGMALLTLLMYALTKVDHKRIHVD